MKFKAICENHLYQKAYTKGKRAVLPSVAVYVLPDYQAKRIAKARPDRRTVNRIGLTVSTKLGGAVVRSRVRRILRAALQDVYREGRVKTGFLIVVAARGAAVNMKSTEMTADIRRAFDRLSLIEHV